jgi:hypothetical protein
LEGLLGHVASLRLLKIGDPGDLMSQAHPFLHPSKPLLAYISEQHEFSLDEEGKESHFGNWHGLHVVSLEKGQKMRLVNKESITLPMGTKRAWICEFVPFGDSGLFVKAALSKNESEVQYYIAELDAADTIKPIAALPAVFM